MYFKYELTHDDLKSLTQKLQRTGTQSEQEAILKEYTPRPPQIEMGSFLTDALSGEGKPAEEDELIFVFSEVKLSELSQLSDDELWKLKGRTEKAILQAVPVLEKSLTQIKNELRKRL